MVFSKNILSICLLFFSVSIFGQERLPFLKINDIDKSTAFDELVELFAESNFFIQTVNKEVGFIQVKRIIKERGLFAKRAGNRTVFNIITKALEQHAVRINIQANLEISDSTEDGYYYRDEGVSYEPRDYEEIITLMESHFNDQ